MSRAHSNMQLNKRLLITSIFVCIFLFAVTALVTKNDGVLKAKEDRIEMLLSVACNHPKELSLAIDRTAQRLHTELPIASSYEDFRAAYTWPCPQPEPK